ncbi:DUF4126 family protein [Coralloluteibacterium stylophorae]|uniref:DUF4126 family protein n=1 Tax=Coralloluteibacterium stylophorae TaxID=1776034 RepID=A0A8J7VRW8_9GAMM|nr:DUF4126 family protein [Coralloluteibacterium stylophorae]MBS7458124.1 DUF4126 family protein [Coralloluteibacterium stylophorae]
MGLVLALLIGLAAGLRALLPLAVVAWAAQAGALDLAGSWLAWLAHPASAWILTALALGELVSDTLPSTPSRTVPLQFGTRVLAGALAGAALGADAGIWVAGLGAGALGAVAGTFGGRALRARLAAGFRRDLPAALVEDAVALVLALLVVAAA